MQVMKIWPITIIITGRRFSKCNRQNVSSNTGKRRLLSGAVSDLCKMPKSEGLHTDKLNRVCFASHRKKIFHTHLITAIVSVIVHASKGISRVSSFWNTFNRSWIMILFAAIASVPKDNHNQSSAFIAEMTITSSIVFILISLRIYVRLTIMRKFESDDLTIVLVMIYISYCCSIFFSSDRLFMRGASF